MLCAVSCKGAKKTAMENTATLKTFTGGSIELVVQDFHGGSASPETLLISDAKTLKAFFLNVNRTRKPGLQVPEIDFGDEMVLVYCSGVQTDGALPDIYVAEETDSQLILAVKDTPQLENALNGATVSPFSLYKMPITDKKIIVDRIKP